MVHPARIWVGGLCAVAVLILGLLAVSPQLHQALHHDAAQHNHRCAVTLFSHGVVSAAIDVGPAASPPLFLIGDCVAPVTESAAFAPLRLPPGRGPPVA